MRKFPLAFAAIVLSVSMAWAGNINSVRDLAEELKNAQKGRLTSADITLLDIRIGQETLDDVRSRLGNTKSFREPPNSASAEEEICYSSTNPSDETHVLFGSGPMGGWSYVTTFQVLSLAPKELPCTPASRISRFVATESGIRLGMPMKELRAKFGSPSEQGPGFVIYSFEQKSNHPKRKEFDMLSGLLTTVANDRVTSFQIFLIESNYDDENHA